MFCNVFLLIFVTYFLVYGYEYVMKSDRNKVLDRGGQTHKKLLDKEKLDIIVAAIRYTKFTLPLCTYNSLWPYWGQTF